LACRSPGRSPEHQHRGRNPSPMPFMHQSLTNGVHLRPSKSAPDVCRGRERHYWRPPAQIPACGFPAPGSCRRSDATGVRGLGGPSSSNPWAQVVGDMRVPALCPEHALALTLPSTGRLPSTLSAPDLSAGVVRGFTGTMQPSDFSCLPDRRRSFELPDPARDRQSGCGRQETSQVPTRSLTARTGLRLRWSDGPSQSGPAHVACGGSQRLGLHDIEFFGAQYSPHRLAVYASRPPSPMIPQHSLPGGRYPLPGPDFHRLDRASFAWRTRTAS
jgi:hypothetical protein